MYLWGRMWRHVAKELEDENGSRSGNHSSSFVVPSSHFSK